MGGMLRLIPGLRETWLDETLEQLNMRFSAGDALGQMTANQKEYGVFSTAHSLKAAYRVLNIGPADAGVRLIWYRFLDQLKKLPSDRKGVNGHDRIILARKENLEDARPLPMYTTLHRAVDDGRVTVVRGYPYPHEDQEYWVISTPVTPSGVGTSASTPPASTTRTARRKRAAGG